MITTRHYIILFCTLLASFWMVALNDPLYAADAKQKEPGDLKYKVAGKEENCRGKYQGKLLAVVVPCIQDAVADATQQMTNEFDEYLKAPAVAFMTLVLTLFGIKMLMNEGDLKKEGLMLLFKMALVFLFLDNFGGFIPAMFGTIDDGIEIVTNSLSGQFSGECTSFEGKKPWNFMDCVLAHVAGFAPGMVVGTSLVALIGSGLQSGQFGASIFAAGTFVIYFILRLIIRATYTYLMAIIIVGFMIIISPIIIPLLILPATFNYFELWLRGLMSCMIQPIVIMAYVTLCFSIMDKIMFDEEIGLAKQMPPDEVKKWQNQQTGSESESAVNSPVDKAVDKEGLPKKVLSESPSINHLLPTETGAGAFNPLNKQYTWDFKEERSKKAQKMAVAMFALIIIAYLLDNMLDELINIMQAILGGGFALGHAVQSNPLEKKMQDMKEKGMQSIGQAADGIKGFLGKG